VVELVLPEAGHLAGPVDQRGQGAELRAVAAIPRGLGRSAGIRAARCSQLRATPSGGIMAHGDEPFGPR
jgi:hypothetical protein